MRKTVFLQQSFNYCFTFQGRKFNSRGKHALLSQASGEGHKNITDGRMGRLQGQRALVARTVAQNDENENQLGGDIQEGGGKQGGDIQQLGGQQGGVHQGGVQQAAGQQAALSRRVHIDQNGGGSNNLELIEVHTDLLLLLRLLRLFCTSSSLLGLIFRWLRPSPRPGTIRAGIFSVDSLSAAGGLGIVPIFF